MDDIQTSWDTLSAGDILRMENEAHEALLAYARNKGWAKAEIELIERNQKYWREKEVEYIKNPEKIEGELKWLKNIDEIREKWPWKKTKLSSIELMAGGGNCKAWAKKLQDAIGGDIMYIRDNYGAPGIGNVFTREGELITTKPWLEHFCLRKNNMFFDRITGPEGMTLSDYKNLFEESKYLNFETIIKL